MATFINPNQSGLASTNVGTGSVLRECMDAYNERCKACGRDDLELAVPSVGAASLNLTQTSRLVYGLMHGLELLVATNRWLDDQASAVDTVLTDARWRTNADLPSGAGNWRRATVWPSGGQPTFLTPGAIAAGDIYGPWVLQDIQKGIDALRWTNSNTDTSTYPLRENEEWRKVFVLGADGVTSFADLQTLICSRYAAESWTSNSGQPVAEAGAFEGPVNWTGEASASKFKMAATPWTAEISRAVEIWASANKGGRLTYHPAGTGWTVENQLYLVESFAASTTAKLVTATIGDDDACPYTRVGLSAAGSLGCTVAKIQPVCKWDFSHTL